MVEVEVIGLLCELQGRVEKRLWEVKKNLQMTVQLQQSYSIREMGRKVSAVSFGHRKEDKTWWWNEEDEDSINRKRLARSERGK